jgi:hypothetical protein
MKICPPGAEPYVILSRLDGFVGNDISRMPNSVVAHMLASLPSTGGRTEVERIRARMVARQLRYQRKNKVAIVLRQRFGLLTR